MNTKLVQSDEKGIQQAVELLQQGEVVAIPTETVYGLAANALDGKAVEKIFAAKGRPQDNPLIVHIDSMEMWKTLVDPLPPEAVQLAQAFWPGPLTIILRHKGTAARATGHTPPWSPPALSACCHTPPPTPHSAPAPASRHSGDRQPHRRQPKEISI